MTFKLNKVFRGWRQYRAHYDRIRVHSTAPTLPIYEIKRSILKKLTVRLRQEDSYCTKVEKAIYPRQGTRGTRLGDFTAEALFNQNNKQQKQPCPQL
jgi:hypothetical protein